MDSSLIEYRAVIKFFVKEGSSAGEITDRLAKVYQQDAPKYSTVAKWAAEFKRGRQSLEDDPRSGRPLEVTTPEVHPQLVHPPCSPYLAPSDFHLFRAMKSDLRGKRFGDDEELISAVDQWFNSQSQDFFHAGTAALEHRWSKCVEVRGDYIEK